MSDNIKSAHLKRCPFCNTHQLTVDCNAAVWWVHCQDCGSDGPVALSTEEAARYWNQGLLGSALLADPDLNSREQLKEITL